MLSVKIEPHPRFLGNVYMKMYDQLGVLYTDEDFSDLFPVK